jgi:hypothetical protein
MTASNRLPGYFFGRFLASTIFVILVRISSSEARAHRSLASAEAAAFFFGRLGGPQRALAAFRARADRSAEVKALFGFWSPAGTRSV